MIHEHRKCSRCRNFPVNKEPVLVNRRAVNKFNSRDFILHHQILSLKTRVTIFQLHCLRLVKMESLFTLEYDLVSKLKELEVSSMHKSRFFQVASNFLGDQHEHMSMPQSRNWGFLDLPAETRLKIYDLLLLNRSPEGDIHAINVVDSPRRRKPYYDPFAIYSSGDKNGRIPVSGSQNSCDYIDPAILRTCKQIAFEGAHVLYSKNVFAINLSREAIAPVNSYPFKCSVRAIMRVMSKSQHHTETRRLILPAYVNELATYAFLKQIGRQNAAMIKRIEIFAQHTNEYQKSMPIITEILKQQAFSLNTAAFYVVPHNGDLRAYDKEEYQNAMASSRIALPVGEIWPFDPNNPSIGVGSWPEVRDAIKNFCASISSLEAATYKGCWNFAFIPALLYPIPSPPRIHFQGNSFDGYHWSLAMVESDALGEGVKDRCWEMQKERGLVVREVVCPEVVNRRRTEKARELPEGGLRESILKFFDGIFWADA